MAVISPHALTVRAYGVGFGDCFLLTFHYNGATGDRHMLIDFGSTQHPPNAKSNLLGRIANDIRTVVGTPLHVLVATHRHADHINGFATTAKGRGTGDRIAALQPQLVIQPWTEDPQAATDATGPGEAGATRDAHRLALQQMRDVTEASLRELRALQRTLPKALTDEVAFLGLEGLSNASAMKNLAAMGAKKTSTAAYVHAGMRIAALRTLLPGVKIEVLGPPTIDQKADLAKQRGKNAREFWQLAYTDFTRFWKLRADTAALIPAKDAAPSPLFPHAATQALDTIPIEDRWFVRRLRHIRGRQLLGLVRTMDDALNNTSVILLMRAGTRTLLFPGDAQWENWEYALAHHADDLREVDIYKVGHHGSLNATPRTLWNGFAKKSSRKNDAGRLTTVMSTRTESKHGHRESGTEVPRDRLVRALDKFSTLRSTQELEAAGDLVLKLEFDLR
jgi:hypothetical protein